MEQKAISSDLIRGHIDTIILHTLINGDKYAQQISDSISEKSNDLYQINQATLYSSLKRLESLKHLKSYWNDSETGRRKYFNLTDSGRALVDENLSSWSYSRSIIDKLMDCEQKPVIIEREKIVEISTPSSMAVSPTKILYENKDANKKADLDAFTQNDSKINTEKIQEKEAETEINFRSILNGLIKTTAVKHVNEDIQTVNNDDFSKKQEVKKFSESLDTKQQTREKDYSIEKVDLSDLLIKADNEGYKMKISSKDSFVNYGTLLINKLNLITSSIIFVLSLIVFFVLKAILNDYITIQKLPTLFTILGLVVYPLISAIIYSLKPNKTTVKTFGSDTVLIALIVIFNLTLITFAGNLLFNIDFSDFKILALSLIFPTAIYFMIVVNYLVKALVSKTKICLSKSK